MASRSKSPVAHVLPALTIPSSRSVDGLEHAISEEVITYSRQPRHCRWCGVIFTPAYSGSEVRRFCGTSCSAKWRMNTPEHKSKVHKAEVYAKRGKSLAARYAAGDSPTLEANRERIRSLNPAQMSGVTEKISRRLKEIGHGPSVRGGNGRGLTEPQRLLLDALGSPWQAEFALSLGRRTEGYPTHYKLDLANCETRVCIEVDGFSHVANVRKAQDAKKTEKLHSLGWTVLRFSNRDILNWNVSGRPTASSISTTLAAHGIRHFP